MFKNWNNFEKAFLLLGTLATFLLTFLFDGTILYLCYTLLYFWAAILLAKGKFSCYIVGIISTSFYAVVSYNNSYYGEVFIAMFCTLPLTLVGLINWLRHQDNTNTVIIKQITKKELLLVLLSQAVMFPGYYFLLKYFNTANLLISTISLVVSIIATYLTARRSEYGFIGFITNDIVLITLWTIPVIEGNLDIIPVLLCPVLLLINDIYGVYNWKRIKEIQSKDTCIN